MHAKRTIAAGFKIAMQTTDAANRLTDACKKSQSVRNHLARAIASTLPQIDEKNVEVQDCRTVKERRLDAVTRLHSAERKLSSFFSKTLVEFIAGTPAANAAALSRDALTTGAVSFTVAVNNAFQSNSQLSGLKAENAQLASLETIDYDDYGNPITTTTTTTSTLAQSTLAADSTTNTAAMAGIVAGIIFCVLFICFIIAIVCYMLSHKNSEPNLNQGNQNQPGTDQSESEGDPQVTHDVVAGRDPREQAHVREFQV